jgi:cytochrome c
VNNLEYNKIAAAVLVALIVAMVASITGDSLIEPKYLSQNAYPVEVTEQDSNPSGEEKKGLDPISPLLAAADKALGEKVFKKCMQCHSVEKGGVQKTGPNLWNVVGGAIAHVADFPYSGAFKEKKDLWTYENLNTFLYKPREFIKGTKMSFAGLSDPVERVAVIAYLRDHSDSPIPLP